MAANDVIKHLQVLNHYGFTNKHVEDSLILKIFQDVPRKRLLDDCAGLNAAAADKTSNLSKNTKFNP